MKHTYGPRTNKYNDENFNDIRNNQFGFDAKGRTATSVNSSVFV